MIWSRSFVVLVILAAIIIASGYMVFKKYEEFRIAVKQEKLLGAAIDGLVLGSNGSDSYPWVNTVLFENRKEASTYSQAEKDFVADHYDIADAHLQFSNDYIQQRNSNIKIIPFTGLMYISSCSYCQERRQLFFQKFPQYKEEGVYLHYKCDTVVGGVNIPGCNLADSSTGVCDNTTPATGCSASTALNLSQSRVPDLWYQNEGWLLPNFLSAAYKAFGVWELQGVLSYYTLPPNSGAYPAHGIFQDNILAGSGMPPSIDHTIEYWGQPSSGSGETHQYRLDQRTYYEDVTQQTEAAAGRQLFWIGNVNSMFWIRHDGPSFNWVIQNPNLDVIAVEEWVAPISRGENSMPAWNINCKYLNEAWSDTVNYSKSLALLNYNYQLGTPGVIDPNMRTFSLASYYLINNPRLFYSYSEGEVNNDLINTEWNRMVEADIGSPRVNPPGVKDFEGLEGTNKFFDWNNRTNQASCTSFNRSDVVMARYFEKGLMLARYKGERGDCGIDCTSYVNPVTYSLANPYGNSYYIVQPDGTLSAQPVQSVTLRTNEAVILVNAPSCTPQWTCSNWSVCANGNQTRICTDQNNCGINEGKPAENNSCSSSLYTISVSKSGQGSGFVSGSGINCGSNCSVQLNSGDSVVLTASPDSGSVFVGWSGACSGLGSCILNITQNFSVTAAFDLVQIIPQNETLSVSLAAFSNSGEAPLNDVDLIATVSGTASGPINYTFYCNRSDLRTNIISPFDHKKNGSSEMTYVASKACLYSQPGIYTAKVIVERGLALPAEARVVINVTREPVVVNYKTLKILKDGEGSGIIKSNPAGINCGNDCTEVYTEGSAIILSAEADNGSTFSGWGGNCKGKNICVVTMSKDVNVTAIFDKANLGNIIPPSEPIVDKYQKYVQEVISRVVENSKIILYVLSGFGALSLAIAILY